MKECDGSAGRIVSERSDKCYETTRLGTPRCRRILGNHRPMETGMGTRSPGSGQSGLLTRTIRYSHAVCRSHQSTERIQTVSTLCIYVYIYTCYNIVHCLYNTRTNLLINAKYLLIYYDSLQCTSHIAITYISIVVYDSR